MVIGVGEAPTAIVPHAGRLWVTSWGDHRIERYELVPRGPSYGAKREIVVQGSADFRPTGMAVAPDGSLYFADWVLRDYPVHGKGRLWRLVLPKDEVKAEFPERSQAELVTGGDESFALDAAAGTDHFGQALGVWYLARTEIGNSLDSPPPKLRLAVLEAQRLRGVADPERVLRRALGDQSTDVRLFAVRWIADERITALRDDVAKLLDGPQPNAQYYLALLGAIDWLDHKPGLRGAEITDELLVRELTADERSDEARTLALSLLKPDNKFLTVERLRGYLRSKHTPLQLEAVRSLAAQTNRKRIGLLAEVARDESRTDEVRAEAVVGLSASAGTNRELLVKLAGDKRNVVSREAKRAVRLAGLVEVGAEAKPQAEDVAGWIKLLERPGDAASGRRVFFSPVGARCSVCHKYDGRGGNIGPDLTQLGRSATRERVITSILRPNQEIAPDYQAWVLTTSDGKTYTGLRMPKPGDDGKEVYADPAGKLFTLASSDIEDRHVSSTSIMPEKLQSELSIDDLRDLVTFLTAEKPVR